MPEQQFTAEEILERTRGPAAHRRKVLATIKRRADAVIVAWRQSDRLSLKFGDLQARIESALIDAYDQGRADEKAGEGQ